MTSTFLEISGRQVGETHDLVQDAIRHAEAGGVSIIVVAEGMADHISRRAPDAIVVAYGQHTGEALQKRVEEMDRVRWFFDEFDWYPEVPVIPGSYYCTTPRFIRSCDADPEGDTLMTLVRELGWPSCQRSCPAALDYPYPADELQMMQNGTYLEVAA